MKNILLTIFAFFILSVSISAQSGSAGLKVFVKCGKISNDGCSVSNAKITLRPIEVWNKSTEIVEMKSDSEGYYSAQVSFGEYELEISAKGFETYKTTAYLPSSNFYEWGVRLHEVKKKSEKPQDKK
jgi:hypothetical protein